MVLGMLTLNLHVLSSVPGTGGPAVGSSPAVSNNKASGTQPATNEVYLVWDDEAMSMVCFYSLFLVLLDYSCFWCIIGNMDCFKCLLTSVGGKKVVVAQVSGA